NFEAMDMMRGEEVETLAILHSLPKGVPYLLVLPGSHTKFVATDARGRITGCLTTITGELLDCITNHTVIADAVGRQFAGEGSYDREMMLRGYEVSKRTGLGRGAFTARILNQFAEKDKQKLASFLLGATLASDVQSVRNSSALKSRPDARVIVSGKNPLRCAIADVLERDGFFAQVEQYSPAPGLPLSALGCFLVADASKA
ncbi:MAG: 2-dehydro-3-deoxygalactonokinase, partial [Faecousia sp.]